MNDQRATAARPSRRTARRTPSIAIAGLLAACLSLAACSPAVPSGSREPVSPLSNMPVAARTGAAQAWRTQAVRLAQALQGVEGAIDSPPEPSADSSPAGTFAARVVDVQPDGALVLDREQLWVGRAAYAQAKRAGSDIDPGLFALDAHPERLRVPVAPGAALVVWYPGETALNVSPSGVAAMSALSPAEFARLFATDSAKRAALRSWGGWATVVDGRLTGFVEANSP